MELYARIRRHYGRLARKVDGFLDSIRSPAAADSASPQAATRNIILHYHNFKTAGTSIDFVLETNFGTKWAAWETHVEPEALADMLAARRKLLAVSSHWTIIRLPGLPGATFFPIVFLRHPLDRIPSIYHWYRKHPRHRERAAEVARQSDLPGFIEWQLGYDRQFRNFYTWRLSFWKNTAEYLARPELDRALETISELPFIGLIERFEASIGRLEAYLKPGFPEFRAQAVHLNATRRKDENLDQRLREFRKTIGADLYQRLVDANRDDLVLYETVLARYENA
jgi:hypothetical protein